MQFDGTDVSPHDPKKSFQPLPSGWYHTVIIGAEATTGKKPSAGEMLKLTIEIDGNEHPSYASRLVFSYLCINHNSEQPRNIARRHLSAICHAIDLFPMNSEEELLGAKVMVRLKVRPAKDGYEASNDIAGFAAPDAEKTQEAPKEPGRAQGVEHAQNMGAANKGNAPEPSWRD